MTDKPLSATVPIKHPETGKTYDFISMKRSWRTDAPEREMKAFTKNTLEWLAQEFWGSRKCWETSIRRCCLLRTKDGAAPVLGPWGVARPRRLVAQRYALRSSNWEEPVDRAELKSQVDELMCQYDVGEIDRETYALRMM